MDYDQGMKESSSNAVVRTLQDFVATLRSSVLLMVVTGLFLLDIIVPDALPFADEIILFLLTLLIARWKSRARQELADPPKPPPKDVTPRASRED